MFTKTKGLKIIIIGVLVISLSACSEGSNKETIGALENELVEANNQVDTTKEMLKVKESEIDRLERIIAEQKETIAQQEERISNLDARVLTLEVMMEEDYSIVKGGLIPLNHWVSDFKYQEILGDPITEDLIELKGDGFTGSFIKELTYEGIDLKLFSGSGEAFWVMEMNIYSNDFKTYRGVKVGDDVEMLMKAYPGINLFPQGKSEKNNGIYQIYSGLNKMKFNFKDGVITSINLLHEIP